MITFQQLQEISKNRIASNDAIHSKLATDSIKKKIIEQLEIKAVLREENFGKFAVGDIIEGIHTGIRAEVVNVRSSYVTCIANGILENCWLHECKVVGKNKTNKLNFVEGQIEYKGYTTKHLSEKMIAALSECRNFNRYLMFSFLTRYDMMVEEADLNKQKALVEQVIGYIDKLDLQLDETTNELDDKMIFEGAQGHITYYAPNKAKVKSLLESLNVDSDTDKYNNEIVVNLLQMIRN